MDEPRAPPRPSACPACCRMDRVLCVRLFVCAAACGNGYRWGDTGALAVWIITHTDRERPRAEELLTSSHAHPQVIHFWAECLAFQHFHPPLLRDWNTGLFPRKRASEGWFSIGLSTLCLHLSSYLVLLSFFLVLHLLSFSCFFSFFFQRYHSTSNSPPKTKC